jgi:hypothetical protein
VLADADEAMRSAMGDGGPPPDDVPHAADDDLPFATCSISHDVNPISRVLR